MENNMSIMNKEADRIWEGLREIGQVEVYDEEDGEWVSAERRDLDACDEVEVRVRTAVCTGGLTLIWGNDPGEAVSDYWDRPDGAIEALFLSNIRAAHLDYYGR
jgi:hypothetical protein